MNEFIEKLIGRLEEKANQTWLVLAERNGYERAIEIVNQLAEEYNNGWIPCSERLPEEHITKDGHVDPSEEVLVYIYYGENCVSNGCGVSRYWEHTKFHKNPWIDLECGKENVVAWQPLPPEYQPKGE